METTWKGSPNFNKRAEPVNKIVIHWFGVGTLESANTRFQNSANKVSAHYGISKGRIWQWVKESEVAYHAGNAAVNAESIGIEHDATTGHNLSDEDYRLSGRLVAEIAKRHNIPLDRQHIIGHREVKPTQCPGTVDIVRIIQIAKSMTIKATVIINGTQWASAESKLDEISKWYKTHSNGRLSFEFTLKYSAFDNIPFKMFPDGSAVIDEPWFDADVLDPQADTTILVVRDEDLPDNFPGGVKLLARTLGFMGEKPTKTVVACGENDMSEIYPSVGAFFDYTRHELMHTCYIFAGEHIGNEYFGLDHTHKYFYDLKQPERAFAELNYENIIKTISKQVTMAKIIREPNGTIRFVFGNKNIGINSQKLAKIIEGSGEPVKPETTTTKQVGVLEEGLVMDID